MNTVEQILAEADAAKAQISLEANARIKEIQDACPHEFVPRHQPESGGRCQLLCDQDDGHEGAPPPIYADCKLCSLSKAYSASDTCPACLGLTTSESVYRDHEFYGSRDGDLSKVPAWVTYCCPGDTHSVKMRQCGKCGCLVALVDNTIPLK